MLPDFDLSITAKAVFDWLKLATHTGSAADETSTDEPVALKTETEGSIPETADKARPEDS